MKMCLLFCLVCLFLFVFVCFCFFKYILRIAIVYFLHNIYASVLLIGISGPLTLRHCDVVNEPSSLCEPISGYLLL